MATLRRRLILSHGALILFVIPLVGFLLIYFLETRVILVNLSTQLSRQAGLLAEFSADYPQVWEEQAPAQAFVDRVRDRMTAQVMLLTADGRLLASGDPADASLVGTTLTGPALDAVGRGESVVQTEYSQNLQAEVADIWMPAFNAEGQVVGAVRLTHQLVNVQERFQALRTVIISVLTFGLGLGGLTAILLATTLERPIEQFTAAIDGMVRGNALQPVPEQGPPELRTLAAAFNSLVERLTLLRAARQQLLANLVHELGRPLGAMRSASQALLDGAEEEPELRDALLKGIDAELGTLQRLLDDLARFYQQQMGGLELQRQRVPLAGWLRTTLAPWREAARVKEIAWETELPDDLPDVTIDPDRLNQAVGNLLSNALKFSPSGSTVRVGAGVRDGSVFIAVSDRGLGIAPEEQAQIFEPFFRSRRERRMPQGMGLGLTIARDLVAAHGGRLEVESQRGEGTCFTIWLPR